MENSKLTIITQVNEQSVSFEAAGYIAYDTAVQFENALMDSFQYDPENITVDMSNVAVFTSIGIRVILKVYKAAKEKGVGFQIENPSSTVRKVLNLSKLDIMLLK